MCSKWTHFFDDYCCQRARYLKILALFSKSLEFLKKNRVLPPIYICRRIIFKFLEVVARYEVRRPIYRTN